MKKCVVIYNPNSGKKKNPVFLKEARDLLMNSGYNVKIILTEYRHHAFEIIKDLDDDTDLVISVGGDGTFNEIVDGNLKRKSSLLISHIPMGTANDLGAMFGYGRNPIQNFKLLLEGEKKEIDICTINDKPFIYVAGFGKFLSIAYETPQEVKNKFKFFAYVKEGIKTFIERTHLFDIEYTINGEKYRGLYSLIIISNANRIAGINNIYSNNVKLNDGEFEVLLCNLTKRRDILRTIIFSRNLDVNKSSGIYFYKVSSIKIKFKKKPKKNWCIDGEKLPGITTTYNIKIDKKITLLMPKVENNSLFKRK